MTARAKHGEIGGLLTEIADRCLDARPAFSDVADKLIEAERRLFNTGRGWPPNTASTKARKARQGLDPRPLHATGKGAKALTVRGATGQKLVIARDELRFGLLGGRTDVFYMRFQKARGRDPLVSRDVIRRVAKPVLKTFLTR